jgi:hypothetical protein
MEFERTMSVVHHSALYHSAGFLLAFIPVIRGLHSS